MSLDMDSKVRNKQTATRRRDGRVKVTSQGQISIPRQAMREAGIKPGERLQAQVDGPGRIILESVEDPILKLIGSGSGLWDRSELEKTRREWERSS